METRIGGIYGLDQIAEQAPEENTAPVGEVLLAWLNGRPRSRTTPTVALRDEGPDVLAALSVITLRRYASIVANRLELRGLGLAAAKLRGANLVGADLTGANLVAADLRGAVLGDAVLAGADVDGRTRWPDGFDWRRAGAKASRRRDRAE